eukprot:3544644-Amphidinium_carterae.1
MEAERKALYEFLNYPNPDEYPWPGNKAFIDPHCTNDDPEKGPMSCDLWYNYCMRQTLLRNYEEKDFKHYFCYVCKKTDSPDKRPPKGNRLLTRCLICFDVWMCREHIITLNCLDSPMGGFPELTEFPIIPKAERWQDIDDICSSKGIRYCQSCESEKDADEFMLVDQASDTTMGEHAAAAASSGERPSSRIR